MIPRTLVPTDVRPFTDNGDKKPPRRLTTYMDDRTVVPSDLSDAPPLTGKTTIPEHLPLDVLIERSLGLAQGCIFLHELLLGGAGIELDDGVAFLDGLAGRRQPGDAQRGHDGRVDCDGAAGVEFSPATDNHRKVALARGRNGEIEAGLGQAVPIDASGGASERSVYRLSFRKTRHRSPPRMC